MRRTILAVLPLFAALAACSEGDGITTTNTGNVILNDAQANYAFENDAILNTEAEDMNAMGMDEAGTNMMQPMNAM